MTKPNADDEAREIVGAFTLELGPTRRPPKATEEMLMQVIAAALTRSRQRVVEVVKAKRDEWQRQADIYEAAEHDSVFAFIKFVAAANEILAELERGMGNG